MLHGIPFLVQMMILIVIGVVVWLGWLCWQIARDAERAKTGEAAMERLGEILTARSTAGELPESLDELTPEEMQELQPLSVEAIHYRPGKVGRRILIRACELRAARKAIDFPRLLPARHVLFSTGQVRLLSDEALERMIEADNRQREQANLDAIDAPELFESPVSTIIENTEDDDQ